MSEEDKLYKEAMQCITDLVDEVIERCADVAEINHFDEQWVLEHFRTVFNKAKSKRE